MMNACYDENILVNNIDLLQSLKIFYNGIKLNNEKKLRRADIGFIGDDKHIYVSPKISWWDAEKMIPQWLHLEITSENPLFDYFYNAALESRIHNFKTALKYWEKRARNDLVKTNIDSIEDTKSLLKPVKHPTSQVIKKYKAYIQKEKRKEEEEKSRKEEQEEAMREAVLQNKLKDKKIACRLNEKYPLKPGMYSVTLNWSESPAIEEGVTMSLKAADIYLGFLDRQQHENRSENEYNGWGWYDKTSFTIKDPNGEEIYTGRYDLGDGESYLGKYGIIAHIMNLGKYGLEYAKKHPNDSLYDVESEKARIKIAQKLYNICYETDMDTHLNSN